MDHHKHERRAVSFVMASSMIEGGFPIFINQASKFFPMMFFGGVTTFIGAVFHIGILIARKRLRQHLPWKTWGFIAGVTLCNSVIALLFIFAGTRYTSGINTALLLQSEMLFSFIFFRVLIGEHISTRQIIGALGVLTGTLVVLYNGSFSLNAGDVLIILGTMFYPIGNMCAKKALEVATSSYVLAVRHIVGGTVFSVLAFMYEDVTLQMFSLVIDHAPLVIFYGVIVLVVSKLFWYEGLKTLALSKAVSIMLAYPIFSVLFAAVFFREIPTMYQVLGMCITIVGLFILVRRSSPSTLPVDIV
jgi:drug/metabolite transporter (DMT)-like permease